VKIIDTRDGATFSGELHDTFTAHEVPDDERLRTYYGVKPGDKNYDLYRAPMPYDRLVIARGDCFGADTESSFYIVPAYPFYVTEA
jgi:hypothetical protein